MIKWNLLCNSENASNPSLSNAERVEVLEQTSIPNRASSHEVQAQETATRKPEVQQNNTSIRTATGGDRSEHAPADHTDNPQV